jgi:glucose uptake protein GlcU
MKKDITLILLIISLALVLVAVTFTANAQSQQRVAGNPTNLHKVISVSYDKTIIFAR